MTQDTLGDKQAPKKIKTTIFPMGFGVGIVDDELISLEFIDYLNDETVVIESIALTASKAKQLVDSLHHALQNIDGK